MFLFNTVTILYVPYIYYKFIKKKMHNIFIFKLINRYVLSCS